MTVERLFTFVLRAAARGAMFAGAFLLAAGPSARANPSGEQVVAGSASFSRSGNTLQINTSDRVIINWQDFSIQAGELTKFLQPGADSAALNKVISGNPSSILGALQANGRIYLVNPNGIMVGGGATINCGAFIASTLDINNAEFLAGGDLHLQGNSAAAIVNQGRISADGGDVFLIARQVDNQGTISAPGGTVGLAAGNEVLLAESGAERLFVRPTAADGAWNLNGIRNAGTLEGAQAELKAHGNIYAFAINNEGVVRATGVELRDGRVLLKAEEGLVRNAGTIAAESPAGNGGHAVELAARSMDNRGAILANGARGGSVVLRAEYIDQSGTVAAEGNAGNGGEVRLDASLRVLLPSAGVVSARARGAGDGGKVEIASGGTMILSGKIEATSEKGAGGAIHATAPRLGLTAAELDASGATRGGEILVGGGAHGQGPLLNSEYTLVNPYATLRADATGLGDGGTVVVWSDGRTDFAGTISARGGPAGGNGGWVEVSGLQSLRFDGKLDLAASSGRPGSVLLDPKNLIVGNADGGLSLAMTLYHPSPGNGDEFGAAMDADGNTLIVGAPGDDELAVNAGRAFVFDGATGALLLTLGKPSPLANDLFGTSVLIGGGGFAVGAMLNDFTGAVYLFDRTGVLRDTLGNPTPLAGEQFGKTLAAIAPQLIAIGAPAAEVSGFSAGEVYVYQTDLSPILLHTIPNPAPANGSRFGQGLAGGFGGLWIGAPFDDTHGADAGIAYQYNPISGDLIQALIPPSLTSGDRFGAAIGLTGGGHLVTIGAPGATVSGFSGAGVVHAFDQWSGSFQITLANPEPHPGDHFGAAIGSTRHDFLVGAPDSDAVAADAGAAYLFRSDSFGGGFGSLKGAMYQPSGQAGAHFGTTLVQYGTSARVAVGAPGFDSITPAAADTGAVYVYTELQGSFGYGATPISLLNPNPSDDAGFGVAVAAGDFFLLVGAPFDDFSATDSGAAYLFAGDTGSLAATIHNPAPAPSDHFGQAVAANASFLAVGAPNKQVVSIRPGQAFVYDAGGMSLWTLSSTVPQDGGEFGFSVALPAWGGGSQEVVVGAPGETVLAYPNAGQLYGFQTVDGTYLGKIENPWASHHGRFGSSIAIGDGGMIYAGAPSDDTAGTEAGAVHAFLGWNSGPLFSRTAWDGPWANDQFGASLAVGGGALFVGAPGRHASAGAVYALSANLGAPIRVIEDPHATAGDEFGYALAAQEHHLLVGAPGDHTGASGAGFVYLLNSANGSMIAEVANPLPVSGDRFGESLALFQDAGGLGNPLMENSFVVGAGHQSAQAVHDGAAYLYQPSSARIFFGETPDAEITIGASTIGDLLGAGLDVILQANNDITIQKEIIGNVEGPSGKLALRAGRSVFIHADISHVEGVTIVANDRAANGVIDAYRDPGFALISMTPGAKIDAGFGTIFLTLNDGAGLSHADAGNIVLADLKADQIAIQHLGVTPNGAILPADAGSCVSAHDGVAFKATSPMGSVGAATTPLRLEAAKLDVRAPAGGAYFELPYGGVTLGNSVPGNQIGVNGLDVAGPFRLNAYGTVSSDPSASFSLPNVAAFASLFGDLTLGNPAAIFGTLLLNGIDVSVEQSGAANLGASAISGDFVLAAAGISQSGAVSVDGASSFTASGAIALADPFNRFAGPVALHTGSSAQLRNSVGTELGESAVGALDVQSAGAITQNGAITATGNARFDAGVHEIVLDHPDNSFSTVAFLSAGDVSLVNNGGITLGASTISGNFDVTANGAIGQSGAIRANGSGTSAIFSAGAANNITLDDPLNDWNTVAIASGNEVVVRDANSVDLGASTISGAFTVNAGGVIVQSGALEVAGNASFGTTGASISLLNTRNAFHGGLDFSGTAAGNGFVEVINSVSTLLGATSVGNDFSLVSNGAITQSGALVIPGIAAFDASNHDLTLGFGMNEFGALILNGVNVTVCENGATVLDGAFATGELTVNSGGALTQTGPIGAHLLFVQAAGAIDLMNAGNQIAILGEASSGGALAIHDSTGGLSVQGLVRGGPNAGNPVTLRAAGGNLILEGGASIEANGGSEIRLVTDHGVINDLGPDVLTLNGGGRFLIYANAPGDNALNGLVSTFTENGVSWPTPPQMGNTGSGELYAKSAPAPEPPPEDHQQVINEANNANANFQNNTAPGGATLFASLAGGAGPGGNVGGASAGRGGGAGAGDAGGAGGDGKLAGGSSLGGSGDGEGGGQRAQGGAGGAGGSPGAPTEPSNDQASVPAGSGMRMGAQGLNGMGFQQMPQTLQRAIGQQIRNQLQNAIGNF